MIPKLVVVDEHLVDFYGEPVKGAQIFKDHLRIRLSEKQKVMENLIGVFGDIFTIISIEQYKDLKKNGNSK